jgi:hypothetical protein
MSVSDTHSHSDDFSIEKPFKFVKFEIINKGTNEEFIERDLYELQDHELAEYLSFASQNEDITYEKKIRKGDILKYFQEIFDDLNTKCYCEDNSCDSEILKTNLDLFKESVYEQFKDAIETRKKLTEKDKFSYKEIPEVVKLNKHYQFKINKVPVIGRLEGKSYDGYYNKVNLVFSVIKHDNSIGQYVKDNIIFTPDRFRGFKKMCELDFSEVNESFDYSDYIERSKFIESFVEKPTLMDFNGFRLFYDQNTGDLIPKYCIGRVMIDNEDPYKIVNRDNHKNRIIIEDKTEIYKFLYPFVIGFSLNNEYGWGFFDAVSLKNPSFIPDAYDQLILNNDSEHKLKNSIKSLILSKNEHKYTDIIPNKSNGLIFLLHGEPGSGKTLTAETVAETLHRPLYKVGFGELGASLEKIETNIQKIFRLASRWNAILLIDEADIIIEKRGTDIVSNAIVCLFLKHIENYQGILFLTTNRVDIIDPAIDSRISIKLHYEFTQSMRYNIWQNQFKKFNIDIKNIHDPVFSIHINGRQISNVIKLSLLLTNGHADKVNIDIIKQCLQMMDIKVPPSHDVDEYIQKNFINKINSQFYEHVGC